MSLAQKLCINIESCNDVVEPSSCFYSEVLQHMAFLWKLHKSYYTLSYRQPLQKKTQQKQTTADVLILN